jgi:hypothetical protein
MLPLCVGKPHCYSRSCIWDMQVASIFNASAYNICRAATKKERKNSKKRKESNISNIYIYIYVVKKHGQVRIWLSSLAPPLPPNPQAPSWVLENPTKTSVHIQHRNPKILEISRASMWIEKKNQTKIPPPKQNQYASGLRPCGLAIFGSRLETGKQFK